MRKSDVTAVFRVIFSFSGQHVFLLLFDKILHCVLVRTTIIVKAAGP